MVESQNEASVRPPIRFDQWSAGPESALNSDTNKALFWDIVLKVKGIGLIYSSFGGHDGEKFQS